MKILKLHIVKLLRISLKNKAARYSVYKKKASCFDIGKKSLFVDVDDNFQRVLGLA